MLESRVTAGAFRDSRERLDPRISITVAGPFGLVTARSTSTVRRRGGHLMDKTPGRTLPMTFLLVSTPTSPSSRLVTILYNGTSPRYKGSSHSRGIGHRSSRHPANLIS